MIQQDNEAAIKIYHRKAFPDDTWKTRHYKTKYGEIQSFVKEEGIVNSIYVPSEDMISDNFPRPSLERVDLL